MQNEENFYLLGNQVTLINVEDILLNYGNSSSKSLVLYFIFSANVTFNAFDSSMSFEVVSHYTPSGKVDSTDLDFEQKYFCGQELTLQDLQQYYFVLKDNDAYIAQGWKDESYLQIG